MILDRGHVRWAVVTVALLAMASLWYALYAKETPGGPTGGSLEGLVFGVVGTACIFFAAFLGLRKKRPHYRLGRLSTWLKGHLWLGALSLPLILFHGGFAFGGPLTTLLMWLFVLVFVTGVVGLLLQQFLPRLMTGALPQETVYEQIDHVREQLLEEAVAIARGTGGRSGAVPKAKRGGAIQGRVVESRAVETAEEGDAGRAPLVRFVDAELRPWFAKRGTRGSNLTDPHKRAAMFEELRRMLDPALHAATRDVEALCEQRAQLEIQRRLHHWLHGWLLVHVPLSWTMVFLTAVHAVMALYY